jgi:hypothetical protein
VGKTVFSYPQNLKNFKILLDFQRDFPKFHSQCGEKWGIFIGSLQFLIEVFGIYLRRACLLLKEDFHIRLI